MRKGLRTTVRWGFGGLLALCLLELLHLSAVAFPYPFFPHKTRFGCCTVYSDEPLDPSFAAVMEDVAARLESTELHSQDKANRVFYCRKQERFDLFARLSLVNPVVQGFNLSIVGNTFVSERRIRRLAAVGYQAAPYGVREGDRAHVIAHELIHDYHEDAVGFMTYYRLPRWKKEGYAEYGATAHAIRRDGTYDLASRIEILETDGYWRTGADFARDYYRAALVVEYLFDVEGQRFVDLMREEVTEDGAYERMTAWYATRYGVPVAEAGSIREGGSGGNARSTNRSLKH
jgi:hypothetical protein